MFKTQLEPLTDPHAPVTSRVLLDAARSVVHSQLGYDPDITAAAVREAVSSLTLEFSRLDDEIADSIQIGPSAHGVGEFSVYHRFA